MSAITKAIDILRQESYLDEAKELERLVALLDSDNISEKSKAAAEIQGLCHIRSYGDLAIKSMNGWEWNSLLNKVAKLSARKVT